MLKKIIPALITALAVLTLCGCVSTKENEEMPEKDDTTAVSFTDALGREVEVAVTPERVAALIGSFADVWQLAGGEVCACPEDAWEDFGLELPDAVNLGGAHSPSLEILLSSNPDFVIASASTAADVEMKEPLEGAGINVAYFDVNCFDDYLSMLEICTDITGRKDLYKQNGTDVKAKIDEIKKQVEDANLSDSERTVLLIRTAATVVKAKNSKGTVLGEMLKDLGCINIADSDEALLESLSIESIIRQEPYRIFVVTMGNDTEKAIKNLTQMMEENPAWGTLDAVKNNRIYVMDKKLFNMKPNAKWADAYEKLSEILLENK